MISIPKHPKTISLTVERQWDGSPCPEARVRAQVVLGQVEEGIRVRVEAPVLKDARIPNAPTGSRVENLWEYDVVEVFLVGPGHEYLELELGAGGHWLLLSFDEVRVRRNEHVNLVLPVQWKRSEDSWSSETVIPWPLFPKPLRAMNAFVIAQGLFLAYSPVPGTTPDFHQPDAYPPATLG
ncbi:MAG: hypothetical protein UY77_C0009G0011 [Candidatus Uhrbacteria bacterium GW2011_GWA2_53_10]|uniref:Uncharacterized protein n=1 Tax=Candidatus Uhrbacteria bacterium GW2011_GWA2_53_10 TaxID=1618980 RepID=A0A0G1XNU5_9BACT|nr:MAG: hypothetical protein UY77_C0009G0011 [Candidatus Uhrbacteria bacterium GW2011_GWA2_53_10]